MLLDDRLDCRLDCFIVIAYRYMLYMIYKYFIFVIYDLYSIYIYVKVEILFIKSCDKKIFELLFKMILHIVNIFEPVQI